MSGSASEIKAGGAYIEIGATTDQLEKALDKAGHQISEWGEKVAGFGEKLALAGEAALAPIELGLHLLAEYGKEVGKMVSQTGISTGGAAGFRTMAAESGVAMNVISKGISTMERSVASGSAKTQAAFAQIGVSTDALKAMKPEEQFSAIAEAIGSIEDPAQRATIATDIFGRAGMAMMPVLEMGGQALAYYKDEAQKLGLALGGEATARAKELHETLNRLKGAVEGLLMAMANAVSGGAGKLAGRLLDVVIYARQWIEANPAAVQGFVNMAANALAFGVALLVIGKAMAFIGGMVEAMGTMVSLIAGLGAGGMVAVGAVVGIMVALFGVLDVLGVTNTGFGDLLNSVKINGVGIADIFASVWNFIKMGFDDTVAVIMHGLQWIADQANKLLPESMQIKIFGNIADAADTESGLAQQSQDKILDRVDTNAGAVSFDKDKAMSGLAKLKASAMDLLSGVMPGFDITGLLESIFKDIPHFDFGEKPGAGKGETEMVGPGADAMSAPEHHDPGAVGTFSSYGGAFMAGSGVFNEQLQAQKAIAKHTEQIAANTSDAGGLGVR